MRGVTRAPLPGPCTTDRERNEGKENRGHFSGSFFQTVNAEHMRLCVGGMRFLALRGSHMLGRGDDRQIDDEPGGRAGGPELMWMRGWITQWGVGSLLEVTEQKPVGIWRNLGRKFWTEVP